MESERDGTRERERERGERERERGGRERKREGERERDSAKSDIKNGMQHSRKLVTR